MSPHQNLSPATWNITKRINSEKSLKRIRCIQFGTYFIHISDMTCGGAIEHIVNVIPAVKSIDRNSLLFCPREPLTYCSL